MQNAAGGKGERGDQAASQQGRAGLRLQHALPNARVVYVSATGPPPCTTSPMPSGSVCGEAKTSRSRRGPSSSRRSSRAASRRWRCWRATSRRSACMRRARFPTMASSTSWSSTSSRPSRSDLRRLCRRIQDHSQQSRRRDARGEHHRRDRDTERTGQVRGPLGVRSPPSSAFSGICLPR